MDKNRRRLLGWGSVGILAGIAGFFGYKHAPTKQNSAGAVSVQGETKAVSEVTAAPVLDPNAKPMSRDCFAAHVGSNFDISNDAASAGTMVLSSVSESRISKAPNANYTCFSLTFSSEPTLALESATHALKHPKLGQMEMFLSPVGLHKKAQEAKFYEAVFSHQLT